MVREGGGEGERRRGERDSGMKMRVVGRRLGGFSLFFFFHKYKSQSSISEVGKC